VLNKYIPHDFDPSLVPRGKKPKDDLVSVRMMLPFSVQCSSCSTFLYRGRKFNSKKEAVGGPEGKYLGIQRWRFYIKCTACSMPLTFMTDPEHADYEMETGGTRTYEVHRDKDKTEEDIDRDKVEDEKLDPMKALENRVLDSQREMADLDNLDEIKAMNMRHLQLMSASNKKSGFHDDYVTKSVMSRKEKGEDLNENGLTATEEALVSGIQFGKRPTPNTGGIKRLEDEDEALLEKQRKRQAAILERQQAELASKVAASKVKPMVPLIKVKRKRVLDAPKSIKQAKQMPVEKTSNDTEDEAESGLGGLLGGYGSDSDSS